MPDQDEAGAAIERMIAEGRRASDVIGRIRAMATKGKTEQQRLCPNRTTDEAVALVRRDLAAHDVTLQLELMRDPPEILADRVQLQQVLVNLMVNAAQAMAQQTDRPRRIVVSTARDGDTIQFEVADNGPGFAAGEAGRLFNAFYSTKPTGMGLGLSIAKSIIEGHGGTIAARAAEPNGASFRFTIPVAASA